MSESRAITEELARIERASWCQMCDLATHREAELRAQICLLEHNTIKQAITYEDQIQALRRGRTWLHLALMFVAGFAAYMAVRR